MSQLVEPQDEAIAVPAAPLAASGPVLVAIGGLSGSGKSLLARRLAPRLGPASGALVLRSDVVRKHMHGIAETERLPASAYTAEVTREVYERLSAAAERALRAGRAVIVDAVFARAGERAAIEAVARICQVPFRGLFLLAQLTVRLERIEARRGDASDADARVVEEQESYDLGTIGWSPIDAGGAADTVLAAALAQCAP
jgi:uncharacterized protein